MKITTKTKLISVFLGLPVFVAGSEVFGQVVDRGRHYCPIHDEIYVIAGEHGGSQCSSTRTAPPVEEVALLYCTRCNTRYPEGIRHICPPPVVVSRSNTGSFAVGSETRKYRTDSGRSFIDIDILAVQQPTRGYIIRDYGGYGYGGRTYYNLSGRNYFRSWFGKDHHHKDHHEPQRHKHSDHHRGYGGGYSGYGSYGW